MTPDPLLPNHAQRLTIYVGESDRWRGKPLYAAILETLKIQSIAGATVVRGVAGFGAHSRIHTTSILRLSEDLPLRVEVIDAPAKIALAVEVLGPMIAEGLMILEDVQVVRYTHRYLNPLPADKLVSEVMTREVVTLTPDMPVADAWQLMLDHLIKGMPVVDQENQVVGMLTDEDLLCCAGAEERLSVAERLEPQMLDDSLRGLRASTLKVADVMSMPPITAGIHESLGVAAVRMAKHNVKRLPVVDEAGRLAGVLSRVDVLQQAVSAPPKSRKSVQAPPGAVRTVAEIMSEEVPAVHQDADLATLVRTFLKFETRRLIVIDPQGRAVGLISDADVVSRIQPKKRRSILEAFQRAAPPPQSAETAQELMSRGVLSAPPETTVVEAAQKMLAEGRKWLVVVDEEDRPLGLVDRQILLRALSNG